MNEMVQQLKERRSIRSFSAKAVPEAVVDRIIEAGRYAPSSMGKQDTIIIAVSNKEVRDTIAAMNCRIGGWQEGFDPFYGAPVILIVLAKADGVNRVQDGSLVMANLMQAAHAEGLGSCWIHRAKEEFETPWGNNLLRGLGIEEAYEGIGHCALGYIDGNVPDAAPRKEHTVFYIK